MNNRKGIHGENCEQSVADITAGPPSTLKDIDYF